MAVVVVPDRGGDCEESLEYAHGDSLMGASAVVFEAELGFQRVVDRFDDLSQASQLGCAVASGFVGACWADEFDTCSASRRSNSAEAYPLSAMIVWPARPVSRAGSESIRSMATSRSSTFGLASANVIGSPVGVHTRCRRSPQKYRECDAQ